MKRKIEISMIWVVLGIALLLGDCAALLVLKRTTETALEFYMLITLFGVMEITAFVILMKHGLLDGLGD